MHDGPQVARYRVSTEPGFSLRRIGRLRHDVHAHPLLTMDALHELAHRLEPLGKCRYMQPGVTEASAFSHSRHAPDGRDLDRTFREIERPGSWIALYDIQRVPAYAQLLREVMRATDLRGDAHHRPQDPRGYVFISAPPSLTPFHIDRDDNFWLQIRGRKRLSLWDRRDRQTVPAREVEAFINYGGLETLRMPAGAASRAIEIDAGPGDGMFFPSTSPHMARTEPSWVTPGDAVCVSLAVTFISGYSRRLADVHGFNCVLRKLGLDPRTETSELVDRVKAPLGRAVIGLRQRFTGYRVPVWD